MGTGALPALAAKRRVLVIVDEHDRERLEYDGGGHVILDNESWVINADDPPRSEIVDRLEAMNLLVPGQIVVQNPYSPDRYVPLATATADIAATKHHLFTMFCHMLGARRVSVVQAEAVTEEGTTTFRAQGDRLGVGGSGSVKHEEIRRLGQQLQILAEASGGSADLLAAEAFLRQHRLEGDQHLVALLEMRRHGRNVLNRHVVTLSLTDQARTNLKVAAKLKVPAFSFSADIERATSRSFEFNLTLEVTF